MDDSNNAASSGENPEDVELQQSRAFLREKFLRLIANISNGQECKFNMHENITVQGKIRAVDMDFENVAVEGLQTPFLPVENAILRASDVISMHLSDVPIESLIV